MGHAQDEATRRVVRMLDQEIRSRGWGAIRDVDRAVGRDRGWWQHRVEAGDLSVQQLLAVLEHLGLEPARFLHKALDRRPRIAARGSPPADRRPRIAAPASPRSLGIAAGVITRRRRVVTRKSASRAAAGGS